MTDKSGEEFLEFLEYGDAKPSARDKPSKKKQGQDGSSRKLEKESSSPSSTMKNDSSQSSKRFDSDESNRLPMDDDTSRKQHHQRSPPRPSTRKSGRKNDGARSLGKLSSDGSKRGANLSASVTSAGSRMAKSTSTRSPMRTQKLAPANTVSNGSPPRQDIDGGMVDVNSKSKRSINAKSKQPQQQSKKSQGLSDESLQVNDVFVGGNAEDGDHKGEANDDEDDLERDMLRLSHMIHSRYAQSDSVVRYGQNSHGSLDSRRRSSIMDRFKGMYSSNPGQHQSTSADGPHVRSPTPNFRSSANGTGRRRSSLMNHMQDLFHAHERASRRESVTNLEDVGVDEERPNRQKSEYYGEVNRTSLSRLSGGSRSLVNDKFGTPKDNGNKKQRWSQLLFACGCVGLIVTLVLLVIIWSPSEPKVAVEASDSVMQANVTTSTSADFGRKIDVSQVPKTSRQSALTFLIQDQRISDVDALSKDPGSPAALALAWISDTDPAQLGIPGMTADHDNLGSLRAVLQRFGLAVLYFAQQEVGTADAVADAASEQRVHLWAKYAPACDWPGVICDGDSLVTAVNLSSSLLQGTLPQEILAGGAFPALTSLDLSHNRMHGNFPHVHAIPTTSALGVDPPRVPLEHLVLNGNGFKGWMNNLMALEDLVELDLSENQVHGRIPETISYLSHLSILQLDNNNLHGNLSSLASLPRLEHLHLEDNSFTGSIPLEMSTLTNLKMLRLGRNKEITGTIPMIIGETLTSLQELNLRETGVKGSIPASLSHLESLEALYLHKTALTGTMPFLLCGRRPPNGSLQALTSDCDELGAVTCSCCTDCFGD